VREEERHGIRARARLVDEVEVDARERDREVAERIERGLVDPPVVARPPVLAQLAQVREIRPVLPARAGRLVRPPRPREPLAKVGQDVVGTSMANGRGRVDSLVMEIDPSGSGARLG